MGREKRLCEKGFPSQGQGRKKNADSSGIEFAGESAFEAGLKVFLEAPGALWPEAAGPGGKRP
jgi:hypothetical protein